MATLLSRDEYVEQAYFFQTFCERLDDGFSAQGILETIHEEILATTRLPIALEFLRGELIHTGRISAGMSRLTHYFTPFQAFVIENAEADKTRFDLRTGFQILQKEAEYKSIENPIPQALFIFQFESLSRNRLGYHVGLDAMSKDPFYSKDWVDWIRKIRGLLGMVDFADLIYSVSQHAVDLQAKSRQTGDDQPAERVVLFGIQEGRIAKANRNKDPLYMFGALQRHLGYPTVPRTKPRRSTPEFEPHIDQRFSQLEQRLALMEADFKGQLDLTKFYVKPPEGEG